MAKSKAEYALYMREYRKRTPEIHKRISLKKEFGITLEYYYSLLKEQNNVCAICKQPETLWNKRHLRPQNLSVDHCHTTGKIRGLLCNNCNRAIGMLKDNKNVLQAALDYLSK